MTFTVKILALPILGVSLAACSDDPYTPILDGRRTAAFQSDLAACRQVSLQRQNDSGTTTGSAVVGGILGGLEADDGNEIGGVVGGALVGGVVGSLEQSAETDEARNQIVFHCMRGRGHNVVG